MSIVRTDTCWDMRTPRAWEYFFNYLLVGSSAMLILMQIIETGVWRQLWLPLFLTCLAMFNIARLRAAELKAAGRCTEWRPRQAVGQVQSQRGAAIGELGVHPRSAEYARRAKANAYQ